MFDSGITQPEDRKIFLSDIIEDGFVDRQKSYCIDANYFKGGNIEQYYTKSRRQLVFGCAMRGRYLDENGKRLDSTVESQSGLTKQRIEINLTGKSNCLSTVQKDSLITDGISYRKLTPEECEKLQTLPLHYTKFGVFKDEVKIISNTRRYKAVGNGWTLEVIKHILSFI